MSVARVPTRLPATRAMPRGYLMIEALVGAAVIGIGLASVLELCGAAQDRQTIAARDFIAGQLAEQGLEISRAQALEAGSEGTLNGLPDCTAGNSCETTAIPVPIGLQGTYTRKRVISSGTDAIGASASMAFKDVTVTVTYNTKPYHSTASGVRTLVMKTRVYERDTANASGGGT